MMNVRLSPCQEVDPACLVEEEDIKWGVRVPLINHGGYYHLPQSSCGDKKNRLDGFQVNVGYVSA